MKRKYSALVILICGLAISAFTGCNSNNNPTEYIIPVINRSNELFSFDDYFRKKKTVHVTFDDEYPVSSMISDVFFTGRYAFILDLNRKLSKIDLKKGKVVNQIEVSRNRGAMTGDDEHLYILDYGTKEKVFQYDLDLNPTDSFQINNIVVSSFIRTKKGFIFLNKREGSNKGKFVVTNSRITRAVSYVKQGEIRRSRRITRVNIMPSEMFIPGSFGNVLCFDPETNNGYKYDGEKLKRLFHIGTDASNPDADPISNVQVIFSLRGNILFHYRNNDDYSDGVAWFDRKNNLIAQGPSCNTDENRLYLYTYRQVGRKLVRIYMEPREGRREYPYPSTGARIDYYRLK